jgi:hypothetical protein
VVVVVVVVRGASVTVVSAVVVKATQTESSEHVPSSPFEVLHTENGAAGDSTHTSLWQIPEWHEDARQPVPNSSPAQDKTCRFPELVQLPRSHTPDRPDSVKHDAPSSRGSGLAKQVCP